MMSILIHSTLLLFYQLSYVTTIHGQAAPDIMLMGSTALDHSQQRTDDFQMESALEANEETQDDFQMESTLEANEETQAPPCPSPPLFPFAELTEEFSRDNNFEIGANIYYKCRHGYQHVPGTERKLTCLENATWSQPDPFCKPNFCTDPPKIQFGQLKEEYLDKTIYVYPEKVTYMCRPGYVRLPGTRSTITCLGNNKWSTAEVFCTRRSCGNPGEVSNADLEAVDFLFGSRVTYKCNEGYRMISKRNYRECLADGTWSNVLPDCEAVSCRSPPSINNGYFYPIKDDYSYYDSVTYICNNNLVLIGDQYLVCNKDGEWNPNPPKCKAVQCPNPNVPNASKLSGIIGPYYLNSAVRFRCSYGYEMKGSDTIKCSINSEWEPEMPVCIGFCQFYHSYFPEITVFSNEGRFINGTTLPFECKGGYELKPGAEENITCEGTKWVNANSCTRISCGEPEPIDNAIMKPGSYLFNDNIVYTCYRGYKMKSLNNRKCLQDGTWSLPIPECEAISCVIPTTYANTEYTAKDFLYGSEVNYKCIKGYTMQPEIVSMKCGLNGNWIGRAPVCKEQTCSPPEELLDGSYIPKKGKYNYLESVTYKCINLTIVGEQTISCRDDGKWSLGAPECKAICTSPPVLKYGELEEEFTNQKFFKINASVQYKCRAGFIPVSEDRTVTCLNDLRWSVPERFCKPRSCGKPEDIQNGIMLHKNFTFGSKVNYTCNPGYTMVSRINFRECEADGTWSGKTPVCKESVCDEIWALKEETRQCLDKENPDEWIKFLQMQYYHLQIENLKLDIELKKKQLEKS